MPSNARRTPPGTPAQASSRSASLHPKLSKHFAKSNEAKKAGASSSHSAAAASGSKRWAGS
eukprot:4340609-Alexandrium_andersonii.AAC.1